MTSGYFGGVVAVPSARKAFGLMVSDGSDTVGEVGNWLASPLSEEDCPAGVMLPSIRRTPLNAMVFLMILFWSFMGVAIGADVFMIAIEVCASRPKRATRPPTPALS